MDTPRVDPLARALHPHPHVWTGAAAQRDAADDQRVEPCGSVVVGTVIVNHGKIVRPSQLIASVGPTNPEWRACGTAYVAALQ